MRVLAGPGVLIRVGVGRAAITEVLSQRGYPAGRPALFHFFPDNEKFGLSQPGPPQNFPCLGVIESAFPLGRKIVNPHQ